MFMDIWALTASATTPSRVPSTVAGPMPIMVRSASKSAVTAQAPSLNCRLYSKYLARMVYSLPALALPSSFSASTMTAVWSS